MLPVNGVQAEVTAWATRGGVGFVTSDVAELRKGVGAVGGGLDVLSLICLVAVQICPDKTSSTTSMAQDGLVLHTEEYP